MKADLKLFGTTICENKKDLGRGVEGFKSDAKLVNYSD